MADIQNDNQKGIDNSIRSLTGIPLSNNRVRALVNLAENHSNPNVCLTLTDAEGKEVSRSVIMSTLSSHIEFTLHVRTSDPRLPLTLVCMTFLDEEHAFDRKNIQIENPD